MITLFHLNTSRLQKNELQILQFFVSFEFANMSNASAATILSQASFGHVSLQKTKYIWKYLSQTCPGESFNFNCKQLDFQHMIVMKMMIVKM